MDNVACSADSMNEEDGDPGDDEYNSATTKNHYLELIDNDEDATLPITKVAALYPIIEILQEGDAYAAPVPIAQQQFEE